MPYKLELNDYIQTKKNHPCGSNTFLITRVGMDFKMKCDACAKEIWIKRTALEKRIKKIIRNGEEIDRANW